MREYKIKVFIPIMCMTFAMLTACDLKNQWMIDILQEKTITFNSNGGSSVPSQKLFAGERVKRPQNPTKRNADNEYLAFSGWYKDNVTFEQPYDFDYIPITDMTLYAKWGNSTGETTPPTDTTPVININDLEKYLNELPANTEANPAKVKLNITNDDLGTLKNILINTDKYVDLDLSGSSITDIPAEVFYLYKGEGCTALVGITIGNSVTIINNNAFEGCTSLTSVTFAIGSNIAETSFGGNAFPQGNGYGGKEYSMDNLRSVYLDANPKWGTYTRDPNGDTWTKQP